MKKGKKVENKTKRKNRTGKIMGKSGKKMLKGKKEKKIKNRKKK